MLKPISALLTTPDPLRSVHKPGQVHQLLPSDLRYVDVALYPISPLRNRIWVRETPTPPPNSSPRLSPIHFSVTCCAFGDLRQQMLLHNAHYATA